MASPSILDLIDDRVISQLIAQPSPYDLGRLHLDQDAVIRQIQSLAQNVVGFSPKSKPKFIRHRMHTLKNNQRADSPPDKQQIAHSASQIYNSLPRWNQLQQQLDLPENLEMQLLQNTVYSNPNPQQYHTDRVYNSLQHSYTSILPNDIFYQPESPAPPLKKTIPVSVNESSNSVLSQNFRQTITKKANYTSNSNRPQVKRNPIDIHGANSAKNSFDSYRNLNKMNTKIKHNKEGPSNKLTHAAESYYAKKIKKPDNLLPKSPVNKQKIEANVQKLHNNGQQKMMKQFKQQVNNTVLKQVEEEFERARVQNNKNVTKSFFTKRVENSYPGIPIEHSSSLSPLRKFISQDLTHFNELSKKPKFHQQLKHSQQLGYAAVSPTIFLAPRKQIQKSIYERSVEKINQKQKMMLQKRKEQEVRVQAQCTFTPETRHTLASLSWQVDKDFNARLLSSADMAKKNKAKIAQEVLSKASFIPKTNQASALNKSLSNVQSKVKIAWGNNSDIQSKQSLTNSSEQIPNIKSTGLLKQSQTLKQRVTTKHQGFEGKNIPSLFVKDHNSNNNTMTTKSELSERGNSSILLGNKSFLSSEEQPHRISNLQSSQKMFPTHPQGFCYNSRTEQTNRALSQLEYEEDLILSSLEKGTPASKTKRIQLKFQDFQMLLKEQLL